MMIRWSANLTMLFKEVPFLERFAAANRAGFSTVEFLWPGGVDLDALVRAKEASDLKVVLFNVDAGDVPAGERGFPNDPTRKEWWRERTLTAFELANRLGTRLINVLAGNQVVDVSRAEMLDCLCENLIWALEQHPDMTLLLEPLNPPQNQRYLLTSLVEVMQVIDRLNHSRVKLQFDLYHVQRTQGELVENLRRHLRHIAHIQAADAPGRNQPGTGEIHWPYVLGQLEAMGYGGYVGLEYNPLPDTLGSLTWLPHDLRKQCMAVQLNL
jgi:hydroxypyruvate isomerase